MQRKPDFFILGAAKSGTTSLYQYLAQHPSIYMPTVKEPNFLAYRHRRWNLKGPVSARRIRDVVYPDSISDEKCYFDLFALAGAEQIVGEASPRYLYYPEAVATIAELAPAARLIVLLRDPVLRAHSHYRMNREFNLEPIDSFEAALAAEPKRIEKGYGWDWHYLNVSRYGAQLQRLLETFSREQIYLCTYERFIAQPQSVCEEICRFLGVSDLFAFDFSQRHKVSQAAGGWLGATLNHPEMSATARFARRLLPRRLSQRIKHALLNLLTHRGEAQQKLQPATYLRLREELREDIGLLQRLSGIDLSDWNVNEARFSGSDKCVESAGSTNDHPSDRHNAFQQ